jgi:hypothetical protein
MNVIRFGSKSRKGWLIKILEQGGEMQGAFVQVCGSAVFGGSDSRRIPSCRGLRSINSERESHKYHVTIHKAKVRTHSF